MSVHLHARELEEVNAAVAARAGANPVEMIEAQGVCYDALEALALQCAHEAKEVILAGSISLVDVVATAYMSGAAIGLLAAERIGR